MFQKQYHGRFRGSRPAPQRSRGDNIHYSKFINKAVPNAVEPAAFIPKHQFADFAVNESLKKSIAKRGYVTPTPIQDQSIPHILEGKDVVGIANTGTGKTGAFLIPLLNKVMASKKESVLIVVPTRELAIQIDDELKSLSFNLGIYSAVCVGGAPIGRQIAQLRYNNHFIIGTPGRLKDLIQQKYLDLSTCSTVVLDEADRMLDMGFIHDMKFILSHLTKERHTLFFSATLSREIENLIGSFLNNPVRVSVKTGDTSKNVDQDVVKIERGMSKLDVLHDLLLKEEFSKVLVFGRTKHGVEKISKLLEGKGHKVASIHGNKTHMHRLRALDQFKANRIKALVATDVAARGLDIADVTHVINFDVPATYEDYVHRIGRTGRGGKKGKALTFVEHN